MISPSAFLVIFVKFSFSGLLWGYKGKQWPEMKNNNYIHHVPYLRNSIAYDHDFWYNCVKWWYLQVFFSTFWYFYFLGFRGVKGQKMTKDDKKICLLHLISQEPYIIWLSFMVHLCKSYLQELFSFFQNFNFLDY